MTPRSASSQALGLAGWLLLAFAAAAVGAVASADAATFYAQLVKPSWAPPAWVFGPVWSVLYALMGVAAWLVWRRAGAPGRRTALALFFVQLALNGAWSWLFFGRHAIGAALVEIVLLLLAILATTVAFHRISRPAGWLLAPYLAWVTFASALTFAIWRLNP